MSKIAYTTRGSGGYEGKPRVYFTGHPEDLPSFVGVYAAKILHIQDCAVFFEQDYEAPSDHELLEAHIALMQLIVMPVTTKLLTKPNRAMDVELPAARKNHVPVLPIMLEHGLDRVFGERFGDIQYVDPNDHDPTRRGFDEVLATYIRTSLVGDEEAAKVRAAFASRVFLSYRKKDRAKAQTLMRMIHECPDCQDTAIWYDEFLIPGENFNDQIRGRIEKSDLFVMAVTPNVVNEDNYVIRCEYPKAVENRKPVLPVEMEETDRKLISDLCPGIPECIGQGNEGALALMLRKYLSLDAFPRKQEDPQHVFLIGLAYLNGIDVEVDSERARRLILQAGEAGVPEAMEQLTVMYGTGKGVARDAAQSLLWRKRHAAYLRERCREKADAESVRACFWALRDLRDVLLEASLAQEAEDTCREMLTLEMPDPRETRRFRMVSFEGMGNIARAQGRMKEAESWYGKQLELGLAEAAEAGTAGARRDLFVCYLRMGDIMQAQGRTEEAQGQMDKAQGWMAAAKMYYGKALETGLALEAETGSADAQRDLSAVYDALGNAAEAQGRTDEAEQHYRESLRLKESLAAETGTEEARRILAAAYDLFGDMEEARGRLEEAEAYFKMALELWEPLAEKSGSLQDRRDLAVCCNKLGNIGMVRGCLDEAEEHYWKALQAGLSVANETGDPEDCYIFAVYCFNAGVFLCRTGRDMQRGGEMFGMVLQAADAAGTEEALELAEKTRKILDKYF